MADNQPSQTPDREDLNRLNKAHNRTVEQARRELQKIWDSVMVRYYDDPAAQRDALLELVSALAGKYTDVDGAAAAEWYETMRLKWFDDDFEVSVGYDDATRWIREGIRTQAGALWGDDPDKLRRYMMANMERWVKQGGRDTVTRNVERDPRKPRFARVPQGPTCGWCVMLASRGWVYSSAEAAGELRKYHNDCNCEIVPSWDKDKPIVEGYDPDDLYQRYLKCRETVEDGLESRYPDERIMVVDRKTRERRWENFNEFSARMIAREIDQRNRDWANAIIDECEVDKERGAKPLSKEWEVGKQLATVGFDVRFIKEINKTGVKTPDAYLNDVPWEFKIPDSWNQEKTVKNQFKKAHDKGTSKLLISNIQNHASAEAMIAEIRKIMDSDEFTYIDEVLFLDCVDSRLTRYMRKAAQTPVN